MVDDSTGDAMPGDEGSLGDWLAESPWDETQTRVACAGYISLSQRFSLPAALGTTILRCVRRLCLDQPVTRAPPPLPPPRLAQNVRRQLRDRGAEEQLPPAPEQRRADPVLRAHRAFVGLRCGLHARRRLRYGRERRTRGARHLQEAVHHPRPGGGHRGAGLQP